MGFWNRIAELLGIQRPKKVLEPGKQANGKQETEKSRHRLFCKNVKEKNKKSFSDLCVEILIAKGAKEEMMLNPKVRDELCRRIRIQTCTNNLAGEFERCSKEKLEKGIQKLISSFPEDDLIGVKDKRQMGLKIDQETGVITYRWLTDIGNIEEHAYSVGDNGNVFIDRVVFQALDNKTLAGEGERKVKKYGNISRYDKYGIEWERVFEQYSKDGTCNVKIRWERDEEVFCVVTQTLEAKTEGEIVSVGDIEYTLKEHCYGNDIVHKVLNGKHVEDLTDLSYSVYFSNHCDGIVFASAFGARAHCKQNPDVVKGMIRYIAGDELDVAQAKGLRKYAEKCGIFFGDKAR